MGVFRNGDGVKVRELFGTATTGAVLSRGRVRLSSLLWTHYTVDDPPDSSSLARNSEGDIPRPSFSMGR